MDKQQTVDKYGKAQVDIWRRSYDIPPPEVELSSPMYPGNDDKYKNIPEAASIRTESLKVRFITLYTKDYVSNLTPIC